MNTNGHAQRQTRKRRTDFGHTVLLIGSLLTGMMLRVYRLGFDSLWYDETVSVSLAKRLPAEIIRHTAGDIHPPGYYLLLNGWHWIADIQVLPGLEYLLGYVSVIWGLLTVALLYPLGRKLLGRRAALLAIWFAALNPFHIWYSQEVRMYTMGSTFGLICLWATLAWLTSNSRRRWLWWSAYALAAAAGLYTLYYFGLLLIAINVIVLLTFFLQRRTIPSGRRLLAWLAAQVVTLLLFAPWLPILWRQATDPPVPPWRMPWHSLADFSATLIESLAALFVGQTPPASILWPWALISVAAILLFVMTPFNRMAESGRPGRTFAPRSTLLLYIFLPITLLYLLTAMVTPLYHVRYLFTYAPPFMLVLSAAMLSLYSYRRWLGSTATALVVLISLASLQQFWHNPTYAADDHRRAVTELADNWRPGDLILVNAGWAYTILDVYWPEALRGPNDSLPPPIDSFVRFHELSEIESTGPLVARTGSVDGDEGLGWGDPSSDFFAINADATTTALNEMAERYQRIWHYRIYDTVGDPQALIRGHLADTGTLIREISYPGRDYLLVQLYGMPAAARSMTLELGEATLFGDVLRLEGITIPPVIAAGERLYVDLLWSALNNGDTLRDDLTMSLRLVDSQGNMLAQRDAPPDQPTSQWQAEEPVRQSMALAIPSNAVPGSHHIELVVYRQHDGMVLPPPDDSQTFDGQRRRLGNIEVEAASR